MSKFRLKWTMCVAAAMACLLTVVDTVVSTANAQDGFVMITDDFGNQQQARQQAGWPVQRTGCESGYCDLGCCDTGGCDTGCCDSGCCSEGCCDECCDDCCGACCCCPPPWWSHMSGFGATFLYLQTSDADVAYAQQVNGIGGAGTVPFGRVGSLGPHHEPGFRATATKAFSECSSLVVGYTFFESNSVDSLSLPAAAGTGGGVSSLVHHPNAQVTASTGPDNAAYDVDFMLADFAYRSILKATNTYAINWSAGGRYASLTQDFRSIGIYSGGAAATIETRSNIDFDGGGLTFGLDGERRFGTSGWSMYSKGTLGALSGRFHADYLMNNNSTGTFPNGVQLAIADWEENRIITTLDLEAGLHWTGEQRKWRASAGYMVSFWFNTLTTSEFINSVQTNNFVDASDTLMFEGLTASLERRW